MTTEKGKDYYIKKIPRMIKEFDKFLNLGKQVLLEYFDKSKIEEIIEKMRKEYEAIIPQLPYIGGTKNIMTMYLVHGATMLAVFRVLEREGMEFRQIGKLSYEFYEITNEKRPTSSEQVFREDYINILKNIMKDSQLRRYPEDWVMKFVESDGKTFDYGYDISECGICKFFKRMGTEHLVPFICLSDFAEARAAGHGLKRTQTIGNGASICDFRFSKESNTPRGWPPDKLPEYKKK